MALQRCVDDIPVPLNHWLERCPWPERRLAWAKLAVARLGESTALLPVTMVVLTSDCDAMHSSITTWS